MDFAEYQTFPEGQQRYHDSVGVSAVCSQSFVSGRFSLYLLLKKNSVFFFHVNIIWSLKQSWENNWRTKKRGFSM